MFLRLVESTTGQTNTYASFIEDRLKGIEEVCFDVAVDSTAVV